MTRLLRVARNYLRLSTGERRLLWRAARQLVRVRAGLARIGFKRTAERLQARLPERARPSAVEPKGLALAVARAARLIPGSACLDRALALWYLLEEGGLPAEIHIGVNREGQALRAHAWVEVAGQVVGERPGALEPFTPFDEQVWPRR